MENTHVQEAQAISVVLTDVDGTLVTKDKALTGRALRAVRQLRERGIIFTITSGRPPFGLRMLVEVFQTPVEERKRTPSSARRCNGAHSITRGTR